MSIDEYNELVSRVNRGKAAPSEHDLQVSCVNWFRLVYPQYAKLLFAIPNGGYRTKTTAKYMRAEGQLAGCPDLHLAIPRKDSHALWIEMKNGKAGRISEKQMAMMDILRAQGYRCEVIRTFDDFKKLIEEYINGI